MDGQEIFEVVVTLVVGGLVIIALLGDGLSAAAFDTAITIIFLAFVLALGLTLVNSARR